MQSFIFANKANFTEMQKRKFCPQVEGGFTTPTGDTSYDLLETKIPPVGRNRERNEKNDYISIDLQDSHPEVS